MCDIQYASTPTPRSVIDAGLEVRGLVQEDEAVLGRHLRRRPTTLSGSLHGWARLVRAAHHRGAGLGSDASGGDDGSAGDGRGLGLLGPLRAGRAAEQHKHKVGQGPHEWKRQQPMLHQHFVESCITVEAHLVDSGGGGASTSVIFDSRVAFVCGTRIGRGRHGYC